ncbi:hypothetical protein OF83DRAFT_1083023 [Amylostereum chailletii]|nr:hypothetical protein OF83DRAFT_1083023 [Amylostereum chailletii]
MSSGKDSYYYDSYGRVHRRNPQDVDPYSYSGSSMSTQGRRTVLPPLTSVFPPTSPSSAAAYPAYPQQRSSHDVGYGQYDPYAASAQQQMQQPYAYPFYTQQAVDARYPGQTPQQSYPRTSPPISSDPRRLPPLSVPQPTDRYQGVPYYPQSHSDPTLISPASDVRSPQASYSYQQYQSIPSSIHPPTTSGSSSSRPAAHPAATGVHHHSSMHVGHGMGVERTLSRHITQMPYARQAVAAVPEYEPRLEPTIKKKRKRADARQLEVLNATYARTAFPSTEERASLAKQLDMTARSVQIW